MARQTSIATLVELPNLPQYRSMASFPISPNLAPPTTFLVAMRTSIPIFVMIPMKTNKIEENAMPPFLYAPGKNKIPVPC